MSARVGRRLRAATAMILTVASLGVRPEVCAGTSRIGSALGPPTSEDEAARQHFQLTDVPKGSRLTVTLRDGNAVVGRYRGLRRSDDAEYAAHVAEVRAARTDSVPIPAPGSMVLVQRGHGRQRPARLEGFGFRGLELRWDDHGARTEVPFEKFATVTDSSGHVWTSDALTIEAVTGRLPMSAELVLASDTGERSVPLDRIQQVEYRESGVRAAAEAMGVLTAFVLVVGLVAAAVFGYEASHGHWSW